MSASLHLSGASSPGAAQARIPKAPSKPGEVAFDRWLNRELTRLYDDALSEPVPEDLLKLIGEVGKK